MTYSSSIANELSPLVLDTSVLINLHACKSGGRILSALPNEILVPEIVVSELKHETSRSNGEHQFLQNLIAAEIVEVFDLDEKGYEVYGELVLGRFSLDDGEAATIATAARLSCLPVIDDQKGRNLCQSHLPDREPAWSLDLFCHPHVVAILGEELSVNAIYLALHDGRMRIHKEHCDYVVSLIGAQRAIECPSLPGYKAKKPQWGRATHSGL
ncbi:PIN domain-containing protein [Geoalkalibacter ferrihydriticus]|uniref:DNA-binding protein n=2 Tax=Geoalkalibacter ferrihydriticus TaxID=392333 RepID=A0A0C2HXP5_9BACT|nr:PIN domain-containing protein [Geoalkalibacter ferrihydriticus]KIH77537.1 DNA-binding protein [Geoalkalibacter ferrihydriticus DSM 17813]SDL66675.1 PIN domain-containing protein [Geoalkalibacter ferrihydriticus]